MKFKVKNRFVYDSITKLPGDIIDIPAESIEKLKRANVLGEPVKEIKIETMTVKPIENEMISRVTEKEVKKSKKGKK